jgi:FkbM family methyltransferase
MHWEQKSFVRSIRALLPRFFENVDVLEIGSFDVNGSVKPLFNASTYIGVDLMEGPGVDVVASGDEFQLQRTVDVVLSCECFEHNPRFSETFENMIGHARPGGLVLFTCATEGRAEHGTSRTTPKDSPGTIATGWEYYRNLTSIDFDAELLERSFTSWGFFTNNVSKDLYFIGIRSPDPGDYSGVMRNIDKAVNSINQVSLCLRDIYSVLHSGDLCRASELSSSAISDCDISLCAPIYVAKAQISWLMEADVDAEKSIKMGLALDDTDPEYHFLHSQILLRLGRVAEAETAATRALAISPFSLKFSVGLANIKILSRDYRNAEELLVKALTIDSGYAYGHQQLSYLYSLTGRMKLAIVAARRAVELDERSEVFRLHLQQLVLSADDSERNQTSASTGGSGASDYSETSLMGPVMHRFPSKRSAIDALVRFQIPIATVLDVGAHKETYDLRLGLPDVKHFLFEPISEFHADLRRNYSNVDHEIFDFALSDAEGEAPFSKHAIEGGEISHGTIVGGGSSVGQSATILTKRLDEFVLSRGEQGPFLLKIDVDGFEIPVLRGAQGIVDRISVIIVEATQSTFLERINFVSNMGFQLFDIIDQCYYYDMFSQADLVFISNRLMQNPNVRPWETKAFSWDAWFPVASLEGAQR